MGARKAWAFVVCYSLMANFSKYIFLEKIYQNYQNHKFHNVSKLSDDWSLSFRWGIYVPRYFIPNQKHLSLNHFLVIKGPKTALHHLRMNKIGSIWLKTKLMGVTGCQAKTTQSEILRSYFKKWEELPYSALSRNFAC